MLPKKGVIRLIDVLLHGANRVRNQFHHVTNRPEYRFGQRGANNWSHLFLDDFLDYTVDLLATFIDLAPLSSTFSHFSLPLLLVCLAASEFAEIAGFGATNLACLNQN